MTGDGQSIERLREYLRTLKPEARSMLVHEIERGLLRGEDSPTNDFILQELRSTIRAAAQPMPRIGDAARLFFTPLEPFLVDGRPDHKRIGRIARVSLEPLWAWLCRDLIPAEAKALSEDIDRALRNDNQPKAEQVVRALHERAVQRMKETIAGTGADEKALRRLAIQIGTPSAMEHLTTLLGILALRDPLAELARRLPGHVRSFEREQIELAKVLLDSAAGQATADGGLTWKNDIYFYGLILVMSRLAAPWQLIRLATRAAETDEVARIAETPYAAAVTIVLSETEWMAGELRAELMAGCPTTSMLKGIHDAARGLRSEMDLGADSLWSRQLAAVRADISGLLRVEIEATPGMIRRLLRPRPAKEIAPASVLDPIEIGDAETRVEFLSACRNFASELAVNEVTMRAHSDLSLYLETGTKVLLDSLRQAGDADRPFRQSQADAAIRFCRTIFGAEYAGLLAKAAEVAVQAAGVERKVVRA